MTSPLFQIEKTGSWYVVSYEGKSIGKLGYPFPPEIPAPSEEEMAELIRLHTYHPREHFANLAEFPELADYHVFSIEIE